MLDLTSLLFLTNKYRSPWNKGTWCFYTKNESKALAEFTERPKYLKSSQQLTKLCDFIRERADIVVIRSTVCSQRSAADVGWLKKHKSDSVLSILPCFLEDVSRVRGPNVAQNKLCVQTAKRTGSVCSPDRLQCRLSDRISNVSSHLYWEVSPCDSVTQDGC